MPRVSAVLADLPYVCGARTSGLPSKLCDLTPGTIQSFRNVLVRQGRSRMLVGKVVSSLGSILAEAMANGQVARYVVREQARHDRRRARAEKRHTTRHTTR